MKSHIINERNVYRKKILMIVVLLLFMSSIFRALSLHRSYQEFKSDNISIIDTLHQDKENLIADIVEDGSMLAKEDLQTDINKLHHHLLVKYSDQELKDKLIDLNFDKEFIDTIDKVFNIEKDEGTSVLTIGVRDYVFYSESNFNTEKFNHLTTKNGKPYITWAEFYDQMVNPSVTRDGFTDVAMKKSKIVILRADGVYPEGEYYTIDDVIKDYHDNGMKNMDQYVILNVGYITENGDIMGNEDINFLNTELSPGKLYIFKSVSVDTMIEKHHDIIKSFDDNIDSAEQYLTNRLTSELTTSIFILFLNIIALITTMLVIKNIDDENIEFKNNDIGIKEKESHNSEKK